MRPKVRSVAISFVVGLLGWLSVSALNLTGVSVFLAAFLVGALAGTLTRQPAAIAGLVAGIVAAYPLALALRFIVFLGDGWAIYAALASALAAAGFGFAILVGRWRRSGSAGSTASGVT